MAGEVRKRKGKKGSRPASSSHNLSTTATTTATKESSQQKEADPKSSDSVWDTVTSHWMIKYMLPFYLLCAAAQFHGSFQERMLQRPESLTALIPSFLGLKFRDPVSHTDERQLLIVGTMSSGTRQITASLQETFGSTFEIGHEMSDARTEYVRDGTVSWIFGIRFLRPPEDLLQVAQTLCQQATYAVGFHPRMYRGGVCSERQQWSKCWERECVDLLQLEWGCAWNNNNDKKEGCTKFQPFRKSLHQTRQPLAVVNSLVAKFCEAPEKTADFVRISSLLFENRNFDEQVSCLEAVAYHVIEYNRALLKAREKGLIHGMYKIEEATPCQVAALGGLNESGLLYAPNAVKYETACGPSTTESAVGHQSMKPKRIYKVNKDRVKLTWSDFEGGKHDSKRPDGDQSLVKELEQLTRDLGYGDATDVLAS